MTHSITLSFDPAAPPIVLETHPSVWTPTAFTTEMCKLIWADACSGLVLDFASGSGILGIVAAKRGASQVVFTDLNPQAIAISKRNWLLNHLSVTGYQGFQSHCFEAIVHCSDLRGQFDRIYSNPPTFPGTILASNTAKPEVLNSSEETSQKTLDKTFQKTPEETSGNIPANDWNRNGKWGRTVTDALISQGREFLAPQGEMLFVTTSKQGSKLTCQLMEHHWGPGIINDGVDPLDYQQPWHTRGSAHWVVVHRVDLPLADYYFEFLPLYETMRQEDGQPEPVFEQDGQWYQKLYFIRATKVD